jgi:hypothetical protein
MKLVKLSLGIVTLAMGVAMAASSYHVTIPADTTAAGTQLKAGSYKVTVEGTQATFKMGKEMIQVPVSTEEAKTKFADTTLESSGTELTAIDLGGTKTKLVIKAKGGSAAAQ